MHTNFELPINKNNYYSKMVKKKIIRFFGQNNLIMFYKNIIEYLNRKMVKIKNIHRVIQVDFKILLTLFPWKKNRNQILLKY